MIHARLHLIGMVFLAATVQASPARIENLAERLAQTAESLASDSYRGFVDRDRGTRADVEALFLVQQFNAGAALLNRMVRDRRPVSELRDAVAMLTEQVRSSSRFGFGRNAWQDMSRTLDEIARELNAGAGWGGREEGRPPNVVTGRMRWKGRVDDRVQIYVQGSDASSRLITGVPVASGMFNFTSPLPQRPVVMSLRKLKGRGSVEIIQQPSRSNGFTAVIEIYDSKGGSEDYEFELTW
jgi:hypothetical protein